MPIVTTDVTLKLYVYYDANGGTGAPEYSYNSSFVNTADLPQTLSVSLKSGPTRTGYNFQGWAATSTATTPTWTLPATYSHTFYDEYDNWVRETTVYAVWKIKTYTITYKPGSNGTGSEQTSSKNYNSNITLKGAIFTRQNYTQTGWSTTDGGSKTYDLSATYSSNSSITLYPVWSANTSSASAPTNIEVTTSYVTASNTVSIRWKGATKGTNNTITGYRIYWKKNASPVIGASHGIYDISSTTYGSSWVSTNITLTDEVNGNASDNNNRGSIYYFKICTKNGTKVNNKWYSDLSTAEDSVPINRIPGKPTINVNKGRFLSTGETVTFTLTPGTDQDTGQTKSVYYATTPTGNKTICSSNSYTTPTLTSDTTYYFWTYDGYEFSSEYSSKTIFKNTKPTIDNNSVTMSATNNIIYTTTADVNNRSYVKRIDGSVDTTKVHVDSNGSISYYKWFLKTINSAIGDPSNNCSVFNNNSSFTNVGVFSIGVQNFNTAYRLFVRVVDDIGEESDAVGSNLIFCIPPVQFITNVYNTNANNNKTNTNGSNFEDYIRFKYSHKMAGVTKIINYINNSNANDTNNIILNENYNDYDDINFNNLTRNNTYNFKIIFKCSDGTNEISSESSTYTKTRANTMLPGDSIIITPFSSATSIKPYTHNGFNISISNQPGTFGSSTNTLTTIKNNYNFKIGNKDAYVGDAYIDDNNNTVVLTVYFKETENSSNYTKGEWRDILNITYTPNDIENIPITIIPKNTFGAEFPKNYNIEVNFSENLINFANITKKLQIKLSNNSYADIPAGNYTLFPDQFIRFHLENIISYYEQKTYFYFYSGTELLNTWSVEASSYTYNSQNDYYIISSLDLSDYILPYSLFTLNDRAANFKLVIKRGNVEESPITQFTVNCICQLPKFDLTYFNPEITAVSKNNNTYTITYTSLPTNIFTIQGQVMGRNNLNEDYENIGSTFTFSTASPATSKTTTCTDSNSYLTSNVLRFRIVLTLTAQYQIVGSLYPKSNHSGGQVYSNLPSYEAHKYFTFYNVVPNLLYGQNFFVINDNLPKMINSVEDTSQLLVIRPTGTHNKLYFGLDDYISVFELTTDGMIIDGGSWD